MNLKGENEMKLNEMRTMKRAPEMPMGRHEVVFEKLQYRVNGEGDITGAFVHVQGYRSLFIPIFEEQNFQLDLLLGQLGCDSYNDEEINQYAGTVITCNRYTRTTDDGTTYTNVSFNKNVNTTDVDIPA